MKLNKMEYVKVLFPLPKHSMFPLDPHPSPPSMNPFFIGFLINPFASTPEVNVCLLIVN